jgi:transcriptional regulator of met regulon
MKVDFELGSFAGLVEKTVLLWTTDDADDSPSSILTVALDIPVLFEVNPKTVFWDQHGDKKPQVIKLKVNSPDPIKILSHSMTNEKFDYQLKTLRDGKEYEIVVTPKDVSLPAFGMVRLTTDSSIPRYRRQMAFVCVRRQAGGPDQ